jgi:glycosyltransferase involved in cell wall biosynthesis
MTITIDCRHINSSGIGVYIRECLPFFTCSEHRVLLLGNTEKIAPFIKDRKNTEIAPCSVKPFSIRELCAFPKHLIKLVNKTDLYYSPYFNIPCGIKIPVYTTIHDLVFFDFSGVASKIGIAIRKWFYKRAVKRSKTIFTVSEFSKSRIHHHFGNQIHVIVTYSAVQPYIRQYDAKNSVKTKIIIFIGNIKKHKGLSVLLKAFSGAVQKGLDYTLIVIGSAENMRSRDKGVYTHVKDGVPVKWMGAVSNEELVSTLASASLLVQPSFYEGFGLPPLEAMILGTPAILSDIPVFKEIYNGFPAIFFKTGDVNDLQNKMLDLLYYNKDIKKIELSNKQKNCYTFDRTALIIMEELCRMKR